MPRPSDHPYGERILQLDPPCTGRDVWELQIKLIGWGSGSDNDGIGTTMCPVIVNGKYDRATRDAVKRFQKAVALPITGIVDPPTFRAIDREAALYPVLVYELRCPCVKGDNDGPILCRCTAPHDNPGKCDGFGKGSHNGDFLLQNRKIPDGSPDGASLRNERLDVYDMQEYDGIDKAVIWAVRALMRRSENDAIKIAAGYRCWHDNYHHTDIRRWRHRRATFHFGKTIEFYLPGCAEHGQNPDADRCDYCNDVRTVAIEKCGFQPRWQEPDRVSVAEVAKDGPPPRNPFAVMVSTVRRRERVANDEFVKSFRDSVEPLYAEKIPYVSFPLKFDDTDNLDPRLGPAEKYFTNNETGSGGWFPLGLSRHWHGGIHLFANTGSDVYAIADGEVVACQSGEADGAKEFGSRNFVLIRHKLRDKTWYSLYMHLQDADAGEAWRRKLALLAKDHVEMLAPSPRFTAVPGVAPAPNRLVPSPGPGFGPNDWIEIANGAAALDPKTGGGAALDPTVPDNCQVIPLPAPVNPANSYVFLKMENKDLARKVDADANVLTAINNHTPLGLPTPIRVSAREKIGKVGAAPTQAVLNTHGAFLHLEVFSTEQLFSSDGYTALEHTDASQVADRKAIVAALKIKKLIGSLPSDVLLEADLTAEGSDINQLAFRSVALKMPSTWKLDWTAALQSAATIPLSFMDDGARNTLGNAMKEYCWWDTVAGNGRLPASHVVWHVHPISWIIHLAGL
jgi:Putative peptidoglycan binding domain